MSLKNRLARLERQAGATAAGPAPWNWQALYDLQAGRPVTDADRAFWSQFYRRDPAPADPIEELIHSPPPPGDRFAPHPTNSTEEDV